MFDNIGEKIKKLAEVLCTIGIIGSIIGGIILIVKGMIIYGLLAAVVGSLFSWIGMFVLYGFGQLVKNSDTIVYQINYYHREDSQTNSQDSGNDSHK